MLGDQLIGRRFLLVRRSSWPRDGGTIYDDYLANALVQLGATLEVLEGTKQNAIATLSKAISEQAPPRFARYDAAISAADLSPEVEIILSHESFAHLALEIPPEFKVHLILHNLPSAFDDEERLSLDLLTRGLAERFEERLFQRPNVRLLVLSRREEAALVGRGHQVAYLPPGCPPIQRQPVGTLASPPEFVISGTFDWSHKRRDAIWLRDSVLAGSEFATVGSIYADAPFEDLTMRRRPTAEFPDDDQLRIGIVPDRFITGMKLKTLWYIANNCIVACPRDLLAEFAGLPHADRFVVSFRDVVEFDAIVSMVDADASLPDFSEFRDACITRFDWVSNVEAAFP